MACDRPVFPGEACERQRYPVLVLDNTTPADLVALMSRDSHLAGHLLPGHQGPILLLGPDGPEQGAAGRHLERLLGRTLEVVSMPGSSAGQNLAILTAHQAAIEKRWNVELTGTAIGYAAGARRPFGGSPGLMLRWVERAAARLSLYASRGSLAGQAIAGKVDTLRRQTLVAMARQHPLADYEQALEQLAIERAAAEVDWHERKAAGTLRRLTVNDLRYELERFESGAEGPGRRCRRWRWFVDVSGTDPRSVPFVLWYRGLTLGLSPVPDVEMCVVSLAARRRPVHYDGCFSQRTP